MANPFVHVELNSTDVAKAKAFYGSLFDWKLEDMPMPVGTYTMIGVGEGTGGGMMTHPVPGMGTAWVPYVLVDDVVAYTKKATDLGAQVVREVTEIPNMGAFSIVMDPSGGVTGLWQNKGGDQQS